MQGIVRTRVLSLVIGLIVVPTITVGVILFAKGYRPNFKSGDLLATGILVAQSYPDAARIYLDGTRKTVTNSNLTLPPGKYTLEIKKDGFTSWKKSVEVTAETVTRAVAWLFPSVPSLKAVTATGVTHPSLSPGGTKVVYVRQEGLTSQLYTLDLSESPLGLLNRNAQLIYTSPNSNLMTAQLTWSPDSRQILAVASASATLIDVNSSNTQDVTGQILQIISTWHQSVAEQTAQKNLTLPASLQNIFATSAAELVWSPKENKILYTATASAVIPDNLIHQLPGSSTQPQSRHIQPGFVYIYDLEEDRNFLIAQLPTPTPTPPKIAKKPSPSPIIGNFLAVRTTFEIGYSSPAGLSWFPTSSHLIQVTDGKVIITEYDSGNPTIVYEGPMFENFAAPFPSGTQMLILSNLNPTSSTLPNLYAVSLR